MVRRETIERICRDVSELPDADLEHEFGRFFDEQETICEFLVDSLGDTSQRARELALYLAYVAYKGMSIDSGLSATIDARTLLSAGDSARHWLDDIDTYELAQNRAGARASSEPPEAGAGEHAPPLGSEPHLLGFLAAEITQAAEGEPPFDDDEKGALMFTLKTIVGSMSLGSSDRSTRLERPGPETGA